MSDASWISDFTVSGRDVRVKKTGAVVRIDRMVAGEAANWLALYVAIKARAALNRLARPWRLLLLGQAPPVVPDLERAAAWNGVRIARNPYPGGRLLLFRGRHRRSAAPRLAFARLQLRLHGHLEGPRRQRVRRGLRLPACA